MCSDSQTFASPHDGQTITVACGRCNQCLSAYRNDWVAKGCAEAAMSTEVLSITLTYRNNPDGSKPPGAITFNYQDIRSFKNRVRQAFKRKYGDRGDIRFIVAGEIGSLNDRVHWHMLLFMDRPVSILGKWFDKLMRKLPGIDWREVRNNPKNRFHWSLWPHGHINVREPDQGGISYVLKYAMKDQFNIVKAKGTARESKAENHGAGYFRATNRPAIGMRWLVEKCNRLEATLSVLPSLKLSIPGYSGYWWPKGLHREYLLQRLHDINQMRIEKYGQNCPQWNTLLQSVVDNEKDWEALYYGEIEEQTEEFDLWRWQEELNHPEAGTRKRCGGINPCAKCTNGHGPDWYRAAYREWYAQQVTAYVTDTESRPGLSLDDWFREKREINPFCGRDLDPEVAQAFTA